ncbi:hypothetical protein T265_06067 [Opisthorchis viverrini]|uniref:Uncharacterized protein n=1 Tax=Opisthorchis viverrini TaxID=6198 RepID=A0A074ZIH7_OPIVI|nr:hypothetical protein T265_06067 [Opisthorchis viverrini]KER26786.1 hypothetical protein T265_06067 [Opisthorchis viverrini]
MKKPHDHTGFQLFEAIRDSFAKAKRIRSHQSSGHIAGEETSHSLIGMESPSKLSAFGQLVGHPAYETKRSQQTHNTLNIVPSET